MSFPRFLAWLVLAQVAGIVVAETAAPGAVFAALGLSFGVAAALRSPRFGAVALAAATSAGAHGLALAEARFKQSNLAGTGLPLEVVRSRTCTAACASA